MKRTLRNATALTATILLVTFMACSDSSGSSKKNTASDTGTTNLSEIDTTTSLDLTDSTNSDVTNSNISDEINNPESDSLNSIDYDNPDQNNTGISEPTGSDEPDSNNSVTSPSSNSDISDDRSTAEQDPAEPEVLSLNLFYFSADDNNSLDKDYSAEQSGNTITIKLPESANITRLVPRFEFSGSRIIANGLEQISGVTENDFSSPILYTVEGDAERASYNVSVIIDTAPVIIAPDLTTLTADTTLTVDAFDDNGILDDSIQINGKLYSIPAAYFLDIEALQPGEFTLTLEATDTFGQTSTVSRTFIIERQSVLSTNAVISRAISIPDPLEQPYLWFSDINMEIANGDNGEILLNADSTSNIIYLDASLQDMIIEADVKLISGNGYNLVVRAEDIGANLPAGYAFNFNPGLVDFDNGLRLSYFPLDIQMSPTVSYTGIETLSGWHRVSITVYTNPNDGYSYLEAYIGIYDDPESGTGRVDYKKVISARIDGISPHVKKNWNRIITTDPATAVSYQSKWDQSIHQLYKSGSFAFALTEAGSRIAVKNIALKEISH